MVFELQGRGHRLVPHLIRMRSELLVLVDHWSKPRKEIVPKVDLCRDIAYCLQGTPP